MKTVLWKDTKQGCDYCGEIKNEPVYKYKQTGGNWKHIYLHYPTCWETLRHANAIMAQQISE